MFFIPFIYVFYSFFVFCFSFFIFIFIFVFCFLFLFWQKICAKALHFLKKIYFFFFLTKILCFALQFLEKLFRCLRSEPLSDKRRSRAGDPRCIARAKPA